MFENTKAFSGFAVDGMSRAMQFYATTLGVKVTEEHGMLGLHFAGDWNVLVYPKQDHTPGRLHCPQLPGGRPRRGGR
jgi:predicted enzyme related to lactoylglutathione lyase